MTIGPSRLFGAALALGCLVVPITLAQKAGAAKSPAVPTIKVSWRFAIPATTVSDAEVEKGTKDIPLVTSCAGEFRIDKMAWVGTSRLDVKVTKLLAGRGPAPGLTIEASGIGGPSRATLNFDVDVNRWPTKGYQLTGSFSPRSIPMPKFWTRVVLTCEE
jgi:hypothetical protein